MRPYKNCREAFKRIIMFCISKAKRILKSLHWSDHTKRNAEYWGAGIYSKE
jgi:hypothetical protein